MGQDLSVITIIIHECREGGNKKREEGTKDWNKYINKNINK